MSNTYPLNAQARHLANASRSVHDFDTSKKLGDKGERHFLRDFRCYLREHLSKIEGYRGPDFRTNDDFLIEVKTDSYPPKNIFIERYSDRKIRSAGGPWQAHAKGADYIIFYFIYFGEYFSLFLSDETIERLNVLIPLYRAHPVKNCKEKERSCIGPTCPYAKGHYVTEGYAISITALKQCMDGIVDEFKRPAFRKLEPQTPVTGSSAVVY
jgi:hypothetical protein